MTGVQPGYFLLGGLLYLVKTCLRALRFQRLNRQSKPSFAEMLRLVLASGLASQLLPLKLGEFAYIYLLKRSRRATISQGLSSLLIARLFDLLAVAVLFILVSLALGLPDSGPAGHIFQRHFDLHCGIIGGDSGDPDWSQSRRAAAGLVLRPALPAQTRATPALEKVRVRGAGAS